MQRPRVDANLLKIETFYISNAQECSVDRQGRILVPAVLRDYAALEKDVIFTAALEKFRIWNKSIWADFNEESENDLVRDPRLFNNFNNVIPEP